MGKIQIKNQEDRNEVMMWVSDLYIDVFCFSPRGYNWSSFSITELEEFVNDLGEQAEAEAKRAEEMANEAEVEFNKRVQEVIDLGAGDRETALKWMLDGDRGDEDLDLYAVEWFTMSRGIDSTGVGRKVEKELISIANAEPAYFGIEQ